MRYSEGKVNPRYCSVGVCYEDGRGAQLRGTKEHTDGHMRYPKFILSCIHL